MFLCSPYIYTQICTCKAIELELILNLVEMDIIYQCYIPKYS